MADTDQESTGLQGFVGELKRRRVIRVALIYGASAYAGLEAADLVLSALGAPGWALSLLVISAFVGFPITVVLSWLYDITPQGIRRTSAEASGPPPTWFSTGSIAVLGGILVALAAGWWLTNATRDVDVIGPVSAEIRSMAVLPFENVGDSEEDDYFADGLGDELRALLSSIGGLDVAARTSSFQVREQAGEPEAVAERLGVQAVLRGTVRKETDRIMVTADLVSVDEGGGQLWNAQYDRLVDDVFMVQSEIATSIVEALGVRLPSGGAVPMDDVVTTNAMAYDKYLWGRFNVNRQTRAGIRDAIDNFSMSIGFDSTYAPAWSGLAESYGRELELTQVSDPSSTIAAGLEAARRAVALDSTSTEARSALALFLSRTFDWAGAESELRRALESDPSASPALLRYADVLTATGRTEQAVAQVSAAVRVDGLSAPVRRAAARTLASSGRMEEAIQEAQQALQLDPDHTGIWTDMGFLFLAAGRFEDARNAFQRLAELTAGDQGAVNDFVDAAQRYLTAAEPGRVPAGLEALIGETSSAAVLYHASVGDVEEALAALHAAVGDYAYDLPTLVRMPALEPVRNDPAFASVAERMGIDG